MKKVLSLLFIALVALSASAQDSKTRELGLSVRRGVLDFWQFQNDLSYALIYNSHQENGNIRGFSIGLPIISKSITDVEERAIRSGFVDGQWMYSILKDNLLIGPMYQAAFYSERNKPVVSTRYFHSTFLIYQSLNLKIARDFRFGAYNINIGIPVNLLNFELRRSRINNPAIPIQHRTQLAGLFSKEPLVQTRPMLSLGVMF